MEESKPGYKGVHIPKSLWDRWSLLAPYFGFRSFSEAVNEAFRLYLNNLTDIRYKMMQLLTIGSESDETFTEIKNDINEGPK